MIRLIAAQSSADVYNETSEDIEHTVIAVISWLSKDAQSFQQSSNLYNSDYFREESEEMKIRLCTALADFFSPAYSNSFWNANKQQV
jgi:hypothetical protein